MDSGSVAKETGFPSSFSQHGCNAAHNSESDPVKASICLAFTFFKHRQEERSLWRIHVGGAFKGSIPVLLVLL